MRGEEKEQTDDAQIQVEMAKHQETELFFLTVSCQLSAVSFF